MTIEELQQRFPAPCQAPQIHFLALDIEDNRYCVGGALCLSQGKETMRFPVTEELEAALLDANPGLRSYPGLWRHARKIIRANDKGDFEAAWSLLAEALAWRERGTEIY